MPAQPQPIAKTDCQEILRRAWRRLSEFRLDKKPVALPFLSEAELLRTAVFFVFMGRHPEGRLDWQQVHSWSNNVKALGNVSGRLPNAVEELTGEIKRWLDLDGNLENPRLAQTLCRDETVAALRDLSWSTSSRVFFDEKYRINHLALDCLLHQCADELPAIFPKLPNKTARLHNSVTHEFLCLTEQFRSGSAAPQQVATGELHALILFRCRAFAAPRFTEELRRIIRQGMGTEPEGATKLVLCASLFGQFDAFALVKCSSLPALGRFNRTIRDDLRISNMLRSVDTRIVLAGGGDLSPWESGDSKDPTHLLLFKVSPGSLQDNYTTIVQEMRSRKIEGCSLTHAGLIAGPEDAYFFVSAPSPKAYSDFIKGPRAFLACIPHEMESNHFNFTTLVMDPTESQTRGRD